VLRRLLMVGAVAMALAFVDQASKAGALYFLADGPITVVPGLFHFRLVYNTGAAFGILADKAWGQLFLITVTVLALGAAAWLAAGHPGNSRLGRLCLGLIAGGAVGNLIDRLTLGKVVDFVDWHVAGHHWPTFNVADAGITIGALGLVVLLVRKRPGVSKRPS